MFCNVLPVPISKEAPVSLAIVIKEVVAADLGFFLAAFLLPEDGFFDRFEALRLVGVFVFRLSVFLAFAVGVRFFFRFGTMSISPTMPLMLSDLISFGHHEYRGRNSWAVLERA